MTFSDGTPVVNARIELRAVDQPYCARGATDGQGRFSLSTFELNDGAIAGKHQVIVVQAFSTNVDDLAKHRAHQSQQRSVDRKFSRYGSSQLEIEIEPKSDNQSLELIVE